MYYCSFRSGMASWGRLYGCWIMGTVVQSASSTYCCRGRIYKTCYSQYSHLIITSVASRSTTIYLMTLPRPPISASKVDGTANVSFSVVCATKRVYELYWLYERPGSLRKYAFQYEPSNGSGVAHGSEPRCWLSIEPNVRVNPVIVLGQNVYRFGLLL